MVVRREDFKARCWGWRGLLVDILSVVNVSFFLFFFAFGIVFLVGVVLWRFVGWVGRQVGVISGVLLWGMEKCGIYVLCGKVAFCFLRIFKARNAFFEVIYREACYSGANFERRSRG